VGLPDEGTFDWVDQFLSKNKFGSSRREFTEFTQGLGGEKIQLKTHIFGFRFQPECMKQSVQLEAVIGNGITGAVLFEASCETK
jgi:hypothetical protein